MISTQRTGKPGIYLVQPSFPPSYWGLEHFMAMTPFQAVFPPLGLLTLAALTPPDYRITLCDINAGETVDYDTDAEIICITGYVLQEPSVCEIADRFRALGKTVVIGGPLANLMPDACRPHCDVLFEGEAEYTWPRFLREHAEGRAADHYVEPEKIHLPDSPPPRLDVLTSRYAHGIVQCTRGCPFTCEFCDIIVMYGRKMRYKPVEQVIQEVEAWHKKGVLQVFFADDNFVGNRAYSKEMLRALIAWNAKQRVPLSYYTQVSIDMARDDELLGLLRDANFISVFIGIESPRKASLAETKKLQNERIDLVAAVHKIQSYNLFISAGMIVGFDSDDGTIFDDQYEFLQNAQIPIVMSNALVAAPKTPLYDRLKNEGRLIEGDEWTSDTNSTGGCNFHPKQMTREELKLGQDRLYRRLYAPDAFAARLLGNLARFNNLHYKPEPFKFDALSTLGRLLRSYWGQGPPARKFLWNCLWTTLWHSPRLLGQMVIFLGMYLHFRRVHGKHLPWEPWKAVEGEAKPLVFTTTVSVHAPVPSKPMPAKPLPAKKEFAVA